MNNLGNNFYTAPAYAYTTMTTRQLKNTLLDTEGRIMACGHLWDVVSTHVGAGVHRVSLRRSFV